MNHSMKSKKRSYSIAIEENATEKASAITEKASAIEENAKEKVQVENLIDGLNKFVMKVKDGKLEVAFVRESIWKIKRAVFEFDGCLNNKSLELNLLELEEELLDRIADFLGGRELSILEGVCRAMSSVPASFFQLRAVKSRLHHHGIKSIKAVSCASALYRLEAAFRTGEVWESPFNELVRINGYAETDIFGAMREMLNASGGQIQFRDDRVRVVTVQLLGILKSSTSTRDNKQSTRDTKQCLKLLYHCAKYDSDSVVDVGTLQVIIKILRDSVNNHTVRDNNERIDICRSVSCILWRITNNKKHQKAVLMAGCVEPFVQIMNSTKDEDFLSIAATAVSGLAHGMHLDAKLLKIAFIDAGIVQPLVAMLGGAKSPVAMTSAASLVCCLVMSHDSPANANAINALDDEGVITPLMKIWNDKNAEEAARAYAGRALVDIACHKISLARTMMNKLCDLLKLGKKKTLWFDHSRSLGVLCSIGSQTKYIDLLLRIRVTEALINVITFDADIGCIAAENAILIGLAAAGSQIDMTKFVVDSLAVKLGLCFGKERTLVRIAKVLFGIAGYSHAKKVEESFGDFHKTGIGIVETISVASITASMLWLLTNGTDESKRHAALVIACLANETNFIKTVTADKRVIESLTTILHNSADNRSKQVVAMALANIAVLHGDAIIRTGTLEPLMCLLDEDCAYNGGEFAAKAICFLFMSSAEHVVPSRAVCMLLNIVSCPTVTESPKVKSRQMFTRSWAVVALICIAGPGKYSVCITSVLRQIVQRSADFDPNFKLGMLRALLEIVEKHPEKMHRLNTDITEALLMGLQQDKLDEFRKLVSRIQSAFCRKCTVFSQKSVV